MTGTSYFLSPGAGPWADIVVRNTLTQYVFALVSGYTISVWKYSNPGYQMAAEPLTPNTSKNERVETEYAPSMHQTLGTCAQTVQNLRETSE